MNCLRNGFSVLQNALYQNARAILPIAVSTAVQAGLQDERVGKIIGGFGLIGSGIGLVTASGVPKILKSCLRQNENVDSSSLVGEAHGKTALRWGTATLGLAATCYGIYNIAMGALELTTPGYNDTSPNRDSRSSSCEMRLAQAKKDLLSCPKAQELWDEVESKGSFTVRCATADEAPAGAMIWVEKREMLISETKDEMVEPMLFELGNFKRAETASLIGQNKCFFDVNEYAKTVEVIEYGTVKDTHEISELCVRSGYWPESLHQYQEAFSGKSTDVDWTSFKGYLETQEKLGHTDLYRITWYKECNPEGLPEWVAKNRAKWQAVLEELSAKNEL